MKHILLYDVYDEIKKVKILENVDSETVSEITKLKAYAVSTYAHTGKPYKGRFSISCVNRETTEKTHDHKGKVAMVDFDNAMVALKKNYTPDRLRRIEFTCAVDKV